MTPTEQLLIAILDGHRPFFTPAQTPDHDARCSSVCHTHHRKDELMAEQYPLWTQDQAIAYEAARDAINDVIAGYSAQIEVARQIGDEPRVTWLKMRIGQARDVAHSFDVCDSAIVAQVLQEFSAVAQVQAGGLPPAV